MIIARLLEEALNISNPEIYRLSMAISTTANALKLQEGTAALLTSDLIDLQNPAW